MKKTITESTLRSLIRKELIKEEKSHQQVTLSIVKKNIETGELILASSRMMEKDGEFKKLVGKLSGEYIVYHNKKLVLTTKNLNQAIDAYNNIEVKGTWETK